MKRWQIGLIAITAILLILGAGYLGLREPAAADSGQLEIPDTVPVTRGDVRQTVTAPGELIATKIMNLTASASGPVAEVNVLPGAVVEAGELLLRLDNRAELAAAVALAEADILDAQEKLDALYQNAPLKEAQALQAIAQAQAQVEEAQSLFDSLGSSAPETSLAAAQADVVLLRNRLEKALEAYGPYRNKPEENLNRAHFQAAWADAQQAYDNAVRILNNLQGTATPTRQSQAEANLAVAQAELALAQSAYEKLEQGIDPQELARAENTLENAEAQLQVAEAQLAGVEVRAPFDGVVLEVNVQAGETVALGTPIIQLTDPNALEVYATVIEEDLPYVKAGQAVEVFFDAAPDEIIQGTVARIVPQRLSGDRPLYAVYVELAEIPAELVAGMTADASIIIAQSQDVLRLPRALVRARPDGTAELNLWQNNQEVSRTVEVGLRGDLYIEIVSGLEINDLVIGQ